jgi:hypothetical protein
LAEFREAGVVDVQDPDAGILINTGLEAVVGVEDPVADLLDRGRVRDADRRRG